MSRIEKSLKNLCEKMTGEKANGDCICSIIDDMADKCEAGGGADWNANEGEAGYVKNRTHYEAEEIVNEPLNITWDGNTEGLVSVDMVDGYGMIACKVSDAILTKEQIEKGFSFVAKNFEDHPYSEQDMTINSIENSLVFAFQKDMIGFLFVHNDNAEFEDYVFPEKGLYFTVSYAYEEPAYILSFTTTEPVEHTKTVVHKLDKKYLPDDIGGSSSGDNEEVIVTLNFADSLTGSDDTVGTADKTFDEVFAKVGSDVGKLKIRVFDKNGDEYFPYSICYSENYAYVADMVLDMQVNDTKFLQHNRIYFYQTDSSAESRPIAKFQGISI